MAYLISGGCSDELAIIAHKAFKFFVKIGPHCADVDTKDIEYAKKVLKEEFGGWSHCIEQWEDDDHGQLRRSD